MTDPTSPGDAPRPAPDGIDPGASDDAARDAPDTTDRIPVVEPDHVPTGPMLDDDVEPALADEPPDDEPHAPAGARPSSRRRWIVLGAFAAVAAAIVGAALVFAPSSREPGPPVPLDAWVPYWTLDDALPELDERLPSMREVSPFWYRSTGATEVGIDPNAPAEAAVEFEEGARDAGVLLVPSIVDAMPAGGMAEVLADPESRRAHVETIVAFADDGDYDGIDLDYEQFAFADGRDTWATTRPNWVRFVTELADELHADGRTLTVSIPPLYDTGRTDDSGFWVYDHGAIAEVVDRIRIMAYDFSVPDPGPIAPLDWVQLAVDGTAAAVDDDTKLVLGIPLYGYNWVVDTIGTCPDDAQGRTSVTARSLADLLARRGGTPVFDDATGEWSFGYELVVEDGDRSCTQIRRVHYVDGDGAQARIQIARDARLGGVALWALGYEDDPAWALVDASVRRWLASTTSTTSTTAAGSGTTGTGPAD